MLIQTSSLQTLLSGIEAGFPIASIALKTTCTLGFVQYIWFSILLCKARRGNSKITFVPVSSYSFGILLLLPLKGFPGQSAHKQSV